MDKKILIDIAKAAILEELTGKKIIDREQLLQQYPELGRDGAVFVTLNENHQLRGCIGSIIAHQPLIDDLIHNAKSAAFSDPRFRPLSKDEFDKLDIEISILTPPKRVEYRDVDELRKIIRVGVDGVIIRKGNHQATYLPSVWEQIPDFDLFFYHLCQKAGIDGNCLSMHPEVYVYQAKKIKE